MYHIRIDYFDDKIKAVRTLYDYNYLFKGEVINNVLLPYLIGKMFVFSGVKLEDHNIRKVEVYETETSIEETVEISNAKVAPNVFFTYTKENVLQASGVSNVTRQLI